MAGQLIKLSSRHSGKTSACTPAKVVHVMMGVMVAKDAADSDDANDDGGSDGYDDDDTNDKAPFTLGDSTVRPCGRKSFALAYNNWLPCVILYGLPYVL